MSVAPIRPLTIEEYHRLVEVGVLREDERVELLHGQIIAMMPIGPFHGGAVDWLGEVFAEASQRRWITRVQSVVQIGMHDEPQPDLMLLKRVPDFYRSRHPRPEDVYLLVEVADSTLLTDRLEKLPVYARAGFPEVWIVNLVERVVEVYRKPEGGAYAEALRVLPGELLSPAAFSDVKIDTGAFLAPPTA
jgi:Uma2 family endonuclease